jgi:hypothetical protein
MTRKKRFVLNSVSVAVISLLAIVFFGAFRFASVCGRCGAIRETTEWQIPLTRLTIFRQSSEHASPVSTVLASEGIIARHEHQWVFCHGGGNGTMCAIGEGRHIRPGVESERIGAVIAASERFGELQFRDRLLSALFNPKTSMVVRGLGVSVPTNGFPDAAAFRTWLSQEAESFDEEVAIYQKR